MHVFFCAAFGVINDDDASCLPPSLSIAYTTLKLHAHREYGRFETDVITATMSDVSPTHTVA